MELEYTQCQLKGSAKKVLFVDDDTSIVVVTKKFLEKSGYDVTVARNGEEAVTLLREEFFPLIILDWMMPGMSGPEVAEWIRERPGGDIPTILIQTAKTDTESQEEALRKGVDDYLVKPYSLKLLRLRLRILEERARDRISKTLADEEVKGIHKQWHELVQTMPDIVYTLDDKGIFTFLNEAIISLGYDPDELVGKHFSFILPSDESNRVSREKVLPFLTGIRTGGEDAPPLFDEKRTSLRGTTGLEVRICAKGGENVNVEMSRQVEISASGLWDTTTEGPEARFLGTVGIIRDVSERHKREEELQKAYQYRAQFLANVSHELRTPLNTIVPLSTLLGENRPGNLSSDDIFQVGMIRQAGDQLLSLINDILEISQAEATTEDITKIEFSRSQFELTVTGLFRDLCKEKHIEFSYTCDDDIPEKLYSDFHRLSRIVEILLENALTFTEKGSISLSLERRENLYALVVTDTGCGIAEENIDKVCDAFYQIDGGYDRKKGGAGLGLAVARKFATLLGGSFEIQSKIGVGTAATFTFKAGLQENTHQNITPKELSLKADTVQDTEMVTIDKEVVLCYSEVKIVYAITAQLEKMGLTVSIMREPWEVAAFFEEGHHADAVLMDTKLLSSQSLLKRLEAATKDTDLFLLQSGKCIHPSLKNIAKEVLDPTDDPKGFAVSLQWHLRK